MTRVRRPGSELTDPRAQLTRGELDALHVLTFGMASRARRTERDTQAGVQSVASGVASRLVAAGLAREVPQWEAVEITETGRAALGRYGHLR